MICAIASPPGNGAIALIRISGLGCLELIERFFIPRQKNLHSFEANRIYYGELVDEEQLVDQVLLSVFKSPHSFTGEDTVEISCHGSVYIQQRIVRLLHRLGVSYATPGEFSKRAFLNGKIDLSQAEGIADLIAASTASAHETALQHTRGGFRSYLSHLRDKLLRFSSLIELELDFSEEDVAFADRKQLTVLITEIQEQLEQLIASYSLGNVIKNGIPVTIAGQPNVGKSTLLNALLNEERALVSDIPGTTRDTIEDSLVHQGLLFRFVDTAGIRDSDDTIEKMGIERTRNALKKAYVVLYLVSASDCLSEINFHISEIREAMNPSQQLLVLVNQIDVYTPAQVELKFKGVQFKGMLPHDRIHYISAKTRENLPGLLTILVEISGLQSTQVPDVLVTNERHLEALQDGKAAIVRAAQGLSNQIPTDLIAQDLREALHHLGKITGDINDDEILGNIFKNFCIGK